MRNLLGTCLAIIVLLSSCSKYEKVLKSNDLNYKLTESIAYYESGKYSKANTIFESLIPLLKGTKSFEGLYYRYAYSFYYMKDYLSASYHFKNFTDFFPTSPQAEEMQFMHALCLFKNAPEPSLDQTTTIKAMEAMRNYLALHPNSKRAAEAQKLMAEGRSKLEIKDASAAKLYYNIGQYKAATVAFSSLLQEYPESTNLDYYHYMIARSWYKYAEQSITSRQEERYVNTVTKVSELKSEYPESKWLSEAEELSARADEQLKIIRKK